MVTNSIDPFERMPFLRCTENSHSVCAVHEGLPPAEDLIQLTLWHIPEGERGIQKIQDISATNKPPKCEDFWTSSTIISLNTNFSKAPDASSFAANSCLRMSPGPYDSTFQNIEVSQRNKTQWSQGNHPPKCEGSRSAKKQGASRGQTTRSMSLTSNPHEQMSATNVINFF